MKSLSERSSLVPAVVGAVGFLCASLGAASAACFSQGQLVPQQVVDKFLGNPSQFLAESPEGGTAMISVLRDLVASNPATLPAVIALLANANAAQKAAIGSALGQAAQACLRPDPTFATQIQQQLAATGDQPAIVAFAAVVGDRPVGAVGGGAASGGAVSGGANGGQTSPLSVASSSGGSLQTFTSNSTPTTAAIISIGSSGAGSLTTTTTTTNIISSAATSVSP